MALVPRLPPSASADAPLRFVVALVNGAALALAAGQAMALGQALSAAGRRATGFTELYAALGDAAAGDAPYVAPAALPPTLDPALPPFALPPAALLFFRPLLLLDPATARSAWTVLQVVALVLALGLLVHQSDLRWPRRFPAVFALLVILFPPVRETLRVGDVEPLLLAIVAVAWALARRGRTWRASVFLGLAAALLPALLILAVPWLVWREWRGPATALGVALVLNAVAALAAGPEVLAGYVAIVGGLAPHWLARADNAALPGFWLRLTTSGPGRVPWLDAPPLGAALSLAAAGGVIAALAWACHAARARRDLAWAAAVVAALLVGPLSASPLLVLLLFPVVLLLRALPLRLGGTWDVLLAALALLVGGPLLLAQLAPPDRWLRGPALLLPALPTLALLALLGLCAALGRQPAAPFARRPGGGD
ncbi:MAG: DUF2029 domain-containing protein [Chloroflexi bacterium]|nr:DUF2029 domain-containing protein [Chloroflexota bacterium]